MRLIFNMRLNRKTKKNKKERRDKKANAIESFKHFNKNERTLSQRGLYLIIEQLRNIKHYPHRNTKIKIERKKSFFDKGT